MYISGNSGDDINEYDLSTAWDLSTASYSQVFSFGDYQQTPLNIEFSSDGTKLFVYGSSAGSSHPEATSGNRIIDRWDLSTAWDVSTMTYHSYLNDPIGDAVYGMTFNNDGTTLYVSTTTVVNVFDMSVNNNSNFVDRSTNAHTVTSSGTPVQTAFHPYLDNWSVEFNGNGGTSGSGLDFGNDSTFALGTGDFTMELWANLTSNSGPFLDWRPDQTSGYYPLFSYNGSQFTWHTNGSTQITGTSSPAINQWHHVAVVRNSGTTTLYVDGNSDGTWSDTTNYLIGKARVGLNAFSGGNDLDGYLSNVRVVKGTAIYTSNFTPPTENLTAVSGTILLTCQDNRFKDNSTNGWTPTITNDPKISAFNPFGQGSEYAVGGNKGSAKFDEGDKLTLTGTAFGTGSFTCEMWIYTSTTPSNNDRILGYGGNNASGNFQILLTTASIIRIDLDGSGNKINGTINVVDNAWHHIAVVRDGNDLTLYIDGQSDGTYTEVPKNISISSLEVAGDPSLADTYDYTGYISDLRISQGTAVYTSTFTPPTAPVGNTNADIYLPMDNAGIFDKTGSHTLTTVGSASTSTTQTKYADTSIELVSATSATDYLVIPSSDLPSFGTSDFTIEFWLYPNSTTTNWATTSLATILDTDGSAGTGADWWAIHQNNATIQFATDSASLITTSSSLTASTWQHVAIVRSGSTITAYIDGTSVGTATKGTTIGGTRPIYIGQQNGQSRWFKGYIENIQILKGVAKYTSNFTPPTATQGRAYQEES